MIDTLVIRVNKFTRLPSLKFAWSRRTQRGGFVVQTGELEAGEQTDTELPYIPRVFLNPSRSKGTEGMIELRIQVSAPKFLFGNNLTEVCEKDLEYFVEKLTSSLQTFGVAVTSDHLLEAKISQIDFCKNIVLPHEFGSATEELSLLSRCNYKSRCKSSLVTYEAEDGITINQGNKSQILRLYAKIPEVNLHERVVDARDCVLRIERSLINTRTICSIMKEEGMPGPPPHLTLQSLWRKDIAKILLMNSIKNTFEDGLNGVAYRLFRESSFDSFEAVRRLNCDMSVKGEVLMLLEGIRRFGTKEAWLEAKRTYKPSKLYRLKKIVEEIKIPSLLHSHRPDLLAYMASSLEGFKPIRPEDLVDLERLATTPRKWVHRESVSMMNSKILTP